MSPHIALSWVTSLSTQSGCWCALSEPIRQRDFPSPLFLRHFELGCCMKTFHFQLVTTYKATPPMNQALVPSGFSWAWSQIYHFHFTTACSRPMQFRPCWVWYCLASTRAWKHVRNCISNGLWFSAVECRVLHQNPKYLLLALARGSTDCLLPPQTPVSAERSFQSCGPSGKAARAEAWACYRALLQALSVLLLKLAAFRVT